MSAPSFNSGLSDVQDVFGRPLKSLRLSVTDRCNLRCKYCMPEEEYTWLPRETILSFEEMASLTRVFTDLGVDKVRLTGGEPLLRRDLPSFIKMLRENTRITDLALTTNGILLDEQAEALFQAGLQRFTVSLDTLQPERFRALTRRDTLDRVLAGINIVHQMGIENFKIDTVAMKGFNDDEFIDLIEYGKTVNAEVRFIEYMDVGGANDWSMDQVVSRAALLNLFTAHYGEIEPLAQTDSAPAQRFRMPDGTIFGIIPSTTTPFCSACDRSRLTADGLWYLCLYAKEGIDLRQRFRSGASVEDLRAFIASVWKHRQDRGAEERKELERVGSRQQYIAIQRLRQDPHLEMHARGG